MKTCNGCKWAEWYKTQDGKKLHPSGKGRCTYKFALPKLPGCSEWLVKPEINKMPIDRKREFENHCSYWEQVK